MMKEEKKGELYIFGEAVLWGIFPVIAILSLVSVPPLVSLGWSAVFAAGFFAILLTIRKTWKDVWNRAALPDILWTTAITGILFHALFFIGLNHTSAGNASIIALSEIFFSFCLFNLWHKEPIPAAHIVGAMLMLLGAFIVLSPNVSSFRVGDILILAASFVAPFGNFFQRRARAVVSSESIMFVRSLLSVPLIFLLASAFGGNVFSVPQWDLLLLFVLNGFFVLGLSKLLWIEGIHRINVAKANALASIAPFVTLLCAYAILKTEPTVFQILSLAPITLGVFLLGTKNPFSNKP